MISGKHKPGLRSVDEATGRRFNLIPFTLTIPENERGQESDEKLKAEMARHPGMDGRGLPRLAAREPQAPKAAAAATAAYLEAQDSMAAWLDECCELDANACAFARPVRQLESLGRARRPLRW
jgi:putative DNA primase/helicase